MSDTEYKKELEKARAGYKDLMERGDEAIGGEWNEFEKEYFSKEEIMEDEFKAFLLGYYRQYSKEKVLDMDKFEVISDRLYQAFKNDILSLSESRVLETANV